VVHIVVINLFVFVSLLISNEINYEAFSKNNYSMENSNLYNDLLDSKNIVEINKSKYIPSRIETLQSTVNVFKQMSDDKKLIKLVDELMISYKNSFKSKYKILFLSSRSVPISTLYNFCVDVTKITKKNQNFSSSVIFRGFDNQFNNYVDGFNKYQRRLSVHKDRSLLVKNMEIRVDPTYFSDLNVTEVPLIALAECKQGYYNKNCDIKYIHKGDISLHKFLTKVSLHEKMFEDYINILEAF
jgi:hypothetical protein